MGRDMAVKENTFNHGHIMPSLWNTTGYNTILHKTSRYNMVPKCATVFNNCMLLPILYTRYIWSTVRD